MAKVELPKVNQNQLKNSTLQLKSINTTVINISKLLGKKSGFVEKRRKFLKAQQAMIKGQQRKADEVDSLKVEKKKGQENPVAKFVKEKSANMLEGIITALGSILMGWLAGKVPELVGYVKKILPRAKAYFDGITAVFGQIAKVTWGVIRIFFKVGKSLFTGEPLDKEGIKGIFDGMLEGWGEMFRRYGNAFNAVTGRDFEDPKDIDADFDKNKNNELNKDKYFDKNKNKDMEKDDKNMEVEDKEDDFPGDKESKESTSGDMSGDGKGKVKPTKGYLAAVTLGKMLNEQGVSVWQHPDFNIKNGYTGSGQESVMKRSANSFHNFGEAFDIPIIGQSEKKLDSIASMLKSNKKKYGINEVKWKDDADHMDHIHLSFKGVEINRRHRRGRPYKAKVDPKPSGAAETTENISSAGDVETTDKNATLQSSLMAALLPLMDPQSSKPNVEGGGTVVMSSGGSDESMEPDEGTILNTMQKNRVLTSLAYM